MREIEKLKETILKEYPRLTEDSPFTFRCHSGVSCFNECCADVNIFLTPYDIIRLKNRLGISSGEFLSKHTISPFDENLKYPIVILKMSDNEKKSCPFVGDDGCTVYTDRPWACRMYPLGLASPKEDDDSNEKEFYFLLEESICQGFKEDKKWTVGEWINDQGIAEYTELGELFKGITLHNYLQEIEGLPPEKVDMFFTAAYNIDKFRDFVFKSSFLEKFDVDADRVAKIKDDDVELLKFGFEWLRFSLYGEKTINVKNSVLESKKAEIAEKMRKKSEEN